MRNKSINKASGEHHGSHRVRAMLHGQTAGNEHARNGAEPHADKSSLLTFHVPACTCARVKFVG